MAHCPMCERDVLVAKDLDADDQWVDVCTRCEGELSADHDVKRYAASSMPLLGYEVGGGASGGCGSGGCGSCSSRPAPER